MTDSRFAIFEPRRLTRPAGAQSHECETAIAPPIGDAPIEDAPIAASDEEACETACAPPEAPVGDPVPTCGRCAARARNDDGIDPRLVRAAAIPLAAAACARALRYAIDRNPRLIVRFVDDALAAAGVAARGATIRMAPDCIAAFDPGRAHAVTADQGLAPGDVCIDTPAGAIGALLEERADLLVRAAAG